MAEGMTPAGALQMAYMLQNPAAGMQMQQQQALAQQMMAQGTQQPDPDSMVSGHVVPMNKWGGLARIGEQLAGAEMQKQNNQKLAAMLQGDAAPAQDAATPSQGVQLGQAMQGNATPTAQDILYGSVAPEWQKNQYVLQQERQKAALDVQNAGPIKAAQTAQTPVDMNGHMTFMTPPGAGASAPLPQPGAPQGNPAITPQSPAGQQALGDLYSVPPAAPGTNPSLMSPQGNGGAVDFNNPIQVKSAEATANKTGENLADTQKTFNVMTSNLPQVMQRFEKMRQASLSSSSGYGVNNENDGRAQEFHKQFDPLLGLPYADANATLAQTSAQGVLPELGPQLAQAGIKGNKFLETLSSNASAIPLDVPPATKVKLVDGLQSQYIANLKSTAQQLRNQGIAVPADTDIDVMVAKLSPQAAMPSTPQQAVTKNWVRQNGRLMPQ